MSLTWNGSLQEINPIWSVFHNHFNQGIGNENSLNARPMAVEVIVIRRADSTCFPCFKEKVDKPIAFNTARFANTYFSLSLLLTPLQESLALVLVLV